MNERPTRPISPGGQLSASEFNRAMSRLDRSNDAGGGGILVSDEFGQKTMAPAVAQPITMRLTGVKHTTDNLTTFAWEEVFWGYNPDNYDPDLPYSFPPDWITTGRVGTTTDAYALERSGKRAVLSTGNAAPVVLASPGLGPDGEPVWYFDAPPPFPVILTVSSSTAVSGYFPATLNTAGDSLLALTAPVAPLVGARFLAYPVDVYYDSGDEEWITVYRGQSPIFTARNGTAADARVEYGTSTVIGGHVLIADQSTGLTVGGPGLAGAIGGHLVFALLPAGENSGSTQPGTVNGGSQTWRGLKTFLINGTRVTDTELASANRVDITPTAVRVYDTTSTAETEIEKGSITLTDSSGNTGTFIPPPATGTKILQSVDGVISWVDP